MISVNDLKNGLTLELDNGLWSVVEFLHVKPGKGAAFVRTKLKNVESGNVIEKTFRAGEKVAKAMLDRREMQYLYKEGKDYVMMDNETYEQIQLTEDQVGDGIKICSLTGRCQHRCHAPFQLGNLRRNRVIGRVLQTGIKISLCSQIKQSAHLFRGIIFECGALIDRKHSGFSVFRFPSALYADSVRSECFLHMYVPSFCSFVWISL